VTVDRRHKKPRYVKSLIRRVFSFYKEFLLIIEESKKLEIIQNNLIEKLKEEVKEGRGQETAIKYVNYLGQWGLMNIKEKRYKHLRPTAKGIVITKLYDNRWEIPEKLKKYVEEKIPTIHILFESPDSIEKFRKMLEKPTLLDILTISNTIYNIWTLRGLARLTSSVYLTNLKTWGDLCNEILSYVHKLSDIDWESFVRSVIPRKTLKETLESINDVNEVARQLDLYTLCAIYFSIREYPHDEKLRYYSSGSPKYCHEFNLLARHFIEMKYLSIEDFVSAVLKAKKSEEAFESLLSSLRNLYQR